MRTRSPSLLLVLLTCAPAFAASSQYSIDTPPSWVSPISLSLDKGSQAGGRGSTDYLLVDRQLRIDRGSGEYVRYVIRLLNQSGIDDESQISITFDPVKDRVHLHQVTLRRDNAVINALPHARVQVLQREPELERGVLDGSLTLHLLLDDVRVGDVIDYSYTIEHLEPEWGNRTFQRLMTGWSIPVQWSHLSVLSRAATPLQLRNHDRLAPTRTQNGGWQRLEWNWHDLAGIADEEDRPSWYEHYPSIELSEFADWAAVAALARSLYAEPAGTGPEFNKVVQQLRAGVASEEDRALAALRFVQEEIRYTGIELGQGAFRPNAPSTVLARRYGDCKDKALLTVALMHRLGIEAVPALVSTHWLQQLDQHLPSPGAMNHVIVRARVHDRTYWLDATDTGQGGTLDTTTQADEGYALPVAAEVRALEPIPVQGLPHPMVAQQMDIDLHQGIEGGTLSVRTQFRGPRADDMRRQLRTRTLEQLGDGYLKYYQKRYRQLRQLAPPRVEDDRRANELWVSESYALTQPFEPNSKGRPTLVIDSDGISSHLNAPDTLTRTAPIHVAFPADIQEITRVHLPHPWKIDADDQRIEGPGFHYESHVHEQGSTERFDYQYQSLADHVSPEQLRTYDAQLEKARNDVGYRLHANAPATNNSTAQSAAPPARQRHPWRPILWLAGLWGGLWLIRRLTAMRIFLTAAVQAASAAPAEVDSIDPGERRVLESRDAELGELGFSALGYVGCPPTLTYYEGPEHLRVFRHDRQPIWTCVQRRLALDGGYCTHLAFYSQCRDGRCLSTTSEQTAETLNASDEQVESAAGLTTAAQFGRHQERLTGRQELQPPPEDLSAAAQQFSTTLMSHRANLRKLGWCVPSADPELDRITLRGAWQMVQRSVRIFGKRAAVPPAPSGVPQENLRLEIEAELLAVKRISQAPRRAPGIPWGLIALSAGSVILSLIAFGVLWGIAVAINIIAVLALHEGGHALLMRRYGHRDVHVFFVPLLGAFTIGRPSTPAVRSRILIYLAGPVPGLLIALAALALSGPALQGPWREFIIALLFINVLNLLPVSPLDGGRVFEALSHPDSSLRLLWQVVITVGVLLLIVKSGEPGLLPLGILPAILIPYQLRMWRLRRAVARRCGPQRDRDRVLRATLEEFAQQQYASLRSAVRQVRARAVAESFQAPVARWPDRVFGVVAYLLSVGVGLAALVLWARMRH